MNEDIDPTENVRLLNEAGNKRQDDLREASERAIRAEVALRAEYEGRLRAAETARIDAIFRESSSAVAAAASVQLAQQNTLAATVATSAEALRAAQETKLAPIQSAIADLQRFQYATGGAKAQTVENRTDQRSSVANVGLWVGVGLAVASFLLTFLVVAGTVTIYLVTKP